MEFPYEDLQNKFKLSYRASGYYQIWVKSKFLSYLESLKCAKVITSVQLVAIQIYHHFNTLSRIYASIDACSTPQTLFE